MKLRLKRKRTGKSQERRIKKAPAGPAKRTAKKLPERRAMIAAARRRIRAALAFVPGAAVKATLKVDRTMNRALRWAHPRLVGAARKVTSVTVRLVRAAGRRLRPGAVLLLRGFAVADRWRRRLTAAAVRGATRASGVLTPERAICAAIVAAAACLIVSQFVAYRSVEVGQPGYAGLTSVASPPAVGIENAGEAHSYLLVPVGILVVALAILAVLRPRRSGLGRVVAGLGLLGIAVALVVDRPAGLDASTQEARFAGAKAVLEDGFYAELASAAGILLCGLLLVAAPKAAARYHARPCRTRTNSFARVASVLRRRRRRRASSRARATRSASPRRSGGASAPAWRL